MAAADDDAAEKETKELAVDRCDADGVLLVVLLLLRLARPPSWPGNWLRGMYAGCVGSALSTAVVLLPPLSDGALLMLLVVG